MSDDAKDTEKDAAKKAAVPAWSERSVLNSRRGIPWWAAAILGFGLTLVGAFVDQAVTDSFFVIFHGCYVVGSVGAVLAVRRRSLFGPMVQPPLAMALAVPLVVLTASGLPEGSDMLSKALAIGTPLINSFPFMAGTTAATVALGALRMMKQRDPDAARTRRSKGEPDDSGAADNADDAGGAGGADDARPATGSRQEDRPRDDRDRKPRRPGSAAREDSARKEAPRKRRPSTPDTPPEARTKGADAPPPRQPRPPRPPQRERPEPGEKGRVARDGEPPPKKRPAPPPAQGDPRRRGDGRAQPPGGRGRRVPPPPRPDEPPRGRQPGGPRRGGPGAEPPRGGRPGGGNRPRPERPWDDDRR